MSKILITSDHAGFALKETLIERVRALGHDVEDVGPFSYNQDDDYPDFVTPLAQRVASSTDERGIVIAGSGQGEAMCANRVKGVRTAVFYGPMHARAAIDIEGDASADGYDVIRLPRMHNDANMLSIGARFVSDDDAHEAVRIFLETPFTGTERHARRIAKF
jgi:ribose 5-phosphate isomerase B